MVNNKVEFNRGINRLLKVYDNTYPLYVCIHELRYRGTVEIAFATRSDKPVFASLCVNTASLFIWMEKTVSRLLLRYSGRLVSANRHTEAWLYNWGVFSKRSNKSLTELRRHHSPTLCRVHAQSVMCDDADCFNGTHLCNLHTSYTKSTRVCSLNDVLLLVAAEDPSDISKQLCTLALNNNS